MMQGNLIRVLLNGSGRYLSADPILFGCLISIVITYFIYFELWLHLVVALTLTILSVVVVIGLRKLRLVLVVLSIPLILAFRFISDGHQYDQTRDHFDRMVGDSIEKVDLLPWVVEGRIDGHGRSTYMLRSPVSSDRGNKPNIIRIRANVRGFPRFQVGSICTMPSGTFASNIRFDIAEQRDIERYLRSKGLLTTVYIDKIDCVGADRSFVSRIRTIIDDLKRSIERHIQKGLVEPKATLILGMIFGDDREYEGQLEEGIRVLGLSHIVAASGSNVSFIEKSAEKLFGNFLPVWLRSILILILLFTFALVAGLSGSVLRAVASKTVKILTRWTGSYMSDERTLVIATSALLCYRPGLIDDVGFQLSIGAVIGLMIGSTIIDRSAPVLNGSLAGKLFDQFGSLIMPSVLCALFTIPISYTRFGSASILTIVPNILILPLIDQIFSLGILAISLSLIWSGGSFAATIIWETLDKLLSIFLQFIAIGSELMSSMESNGSDSKVFALSLFLLVILMTYILKSSDNYYLMNSKT